VFVVFYFTDERDIKLYALLVFAGAGLSDILDGYLARKFKAQSKLGKLLDPLGDKLMTFTAMVCITLVRPVILWAVVIFFVKELLMGIGGFLLLKKTRNELPPSNVLGKISNVVFFLVCAALMLFSSLGDAFALILISVATTLSLVALGGYIISYIKIMKSVSNNENIGEV
jgi:cardiolipin synthase